MWLWFFITQCITRSEVCVRCVVFVCPHVRFANGEYFSLLFKIEFSIVEAESHFAQLSLARNSNLHRSHCGLAFDDALPPLPPSSPALFPPSHFSICRTLSLNFTADFHALSQFTNSLAYFSPYKCWKCRKKNVAPHVNGWEHTVSLKS